MSSQRRADSELSRQHNKALNRDSVTPMAPPRSAIPSTRHVMYAATVTGITSSIVCLVLRFLAWIFRVDFHVILPGDIDLDTSSWALVIILPFAAAMISGLVTALFLGVPGCRGWILLLGTAGLLVCLVYPFLQPEATTWPTRVFVILMELVTYVLVIPQLARVVGDSDPRITVYYRDDTAGV
ncbi:MAG: hypothetical protein KDC39_15630 [Actinobacteria bacterium]|nr:hypothetical protein [Actinomycetota bacterium]